MPPRPGTRVQARPSLKKMTAKLARYAGKRGLVVETRGTDALVAFEGGKVTLYPGADLASVR